MRMEQQRKEAEDKQNARSACNEVTLLGGKFASIKDANSKILADDTGLQI